MSTEDPAPDRVILGDVWHTPPKVQDEVLHAIAEALQQTTSKMPGFLGATVLASESGTEVMVQIEWETAKHAQQIEGAPDIGRLIRDLRGVARQDRNTYRLAARIDP